MFIAEPKPKSYLEIIRSEVEEIIASGQNSRARELSASTRQEFSFYGYPQYFQGNLEAKVVFINLNCRRKAAQNQLKYQNFGAYLQACQARKSNKEIRASGSLSELKALDFLEGFAEDLSSDRLDLYLIPYLNKELSLVGFTPKILRSFIETNLAIITEYPRDYIIFNGSAFEQILRPYIVQKQHLEINSDRVNKLKFSLLNLVARERTITAGLTHSYNSMSMSAKEYGQHCQQLFDAA